MIFGPPAVGKMTVGYELGKLTDYKLFHNHMAIEPLLGIFPFGSPPFVRLVDMFRRGVIEEAAASGLAGLVFTYVWALDEPGDKELVEKYSAIATGSGGQVYLVELVATQAERLRRNATSFRLEHKRSKRDLEFSRANLVKMDEKYRLNTAEDFRFDGHHLKIDNTHLPADEAARRIVKAFDVPTVAG